MRTNERLRRELPYGKWTCTDGREVLFNRQYHPIWQRLGGISARADRTEWVRNIQTQEYFYTDGTPRRGLIRKLQIILERFHAGR